MDTASVIQQFLRQRRDRGLLVPAKLAVAMGFRSPSMLSMVLNKTRPFPMGRIDQVAAFFGLSTEDLIILAKQETRRESEAEHAPAHSAAVGSFRQRPAKTVHAPHGAPRKRAK